MAGGDSCYTSAPLGSCEFGSEMCAPYKCGGAYCNSMCSSQLDCTFGYGCVNARCVRKGTCGACSSDLDCGLFRCDTSAGACKERCFSDVDCQVGAKCVDSQCVH